MRDFLANLRIFIKKLDTWLLTLSLIASAFGTVLIASATASYGSGSFIKIQIAAICIGIVLYILISIADRIPAFPHLP